MKDKKKYLVVLPSNDKTAGIIKEIKAINKDLFEFVILGDLDPNKQLLDKKIKLASQGPHRMIYYFINNGF